MNQRHCIHTAIAATTRLKRNRSQLLHYCLLFKKNCSYTNTMITRVP